MSIENNKILEVKDLRISFRTNGGTVKAVRGISFDLYKGRTLAIVGESGSGKSVTSKAILGILANNKIIEGGQILYDGQDLLKIDEEHFHKIRGVKISMIFQDPLSSLNPIMIVGKQLTEAIELKHKADVKEAKKDLARFNHALILADKLIGKELRQKSDEAYPTRSTKYLSVLEKARDKCLSLFSSKKEKPITEKKEYNINDYLPLFEKAAELDCKERAKAIELVLPKLKRILTEEFGKENISIEAIYLSLKALAKETKRCVLHMANASDNIVEVFPTVNKNHLDTYRDSKKNMAKQTKAMEKYHVNDFYSLPPSERAKLPEIILSVENQIASYKKDLEELIAHLENLLKLDDDYVKSYAKEALNVYEEALKIRASKLTKHEAKEKAIKMLGEVGIDEPERRYKQYPFELSGGMRQRIVIAIALCSSPEVLICDEPTTALDVTIQAQILELINKLKAERNLSIVFITHDLGVVANMADDIAVMYAGKIVEYGTAKEIFYDPRHPYTWALLGSMPDLNTKEELNAIPGTPPNMLLPPKGDAFAARNEHALKIDELEQPPFFEVSKTHFAATWNLHPNARDLHAPDVVIARIKDALMKHPEATPLPDNYKNSILNDIKAKPVPAEKEEKPVAKAAKSVKTTKAKKEPKKEVKHGK